MKRYRAVGVAVALLAATLGIGASEHEHAEPSEPAVLAPGWTPLEFVAPEPGSYALPPLWRAGDARVVDESGDALDLAELLGDKVVVMSFMYTSCNDANGCPLATHVLKGVHNAVLEDEELKRRVRLISVSFDRAHDTPEVMAEYASAFRADRADWRFLTTAKDEDLATLLERYDQWTIRDYDAEGRALGTISHLLRVYLIDSERQVRNIYSVSFLHTDTVMSDIRTVLLGASLRE